MQFGNRRKILMPFMCEEHTTAYCSTPGVQHPVSPMKENCRPPLQLSLVLESFSWSSRDWHTYFLAYNPLNNSWKLQTTGVYSKVYPVFCSWKTESAVTMGARSAGSGTKGCLGWPLNQFPNIYETVHRSPVFWGCMGINLLQVVIKLSLILIGLGSDRP